ncbi:toxin VasX [Herbaspirillum rubrisubalbicans]|uniref:toxin VasX n=1 Tax=Herbaspirillum rubrisubalbicans TaxID=80842 RepID=UPI0002E93610|nr:toxin VasX [Herbaspirillum rubrisubalbicans]
MNASATATRDKVIGNAINATAGPPPLCVSANCQTCRRADLQLLIVTPSVAPLEHAATLQRAGHQWSSVLDTGFAAIKREATVPVARLARSGYFMLYFAQSQRWDIWQVMGNGIARKIMHQVSVKQYAALVTGFLTATSPKTCSRGAANLEAPLISINGAKDVPSVWLAYTPRLWSPPVLQRYADNPMVDLPGPDGKPVGQEKLRTLRGREIHPAKWIKQSEFPQSGCLPLTAANLEQHVADFVKEGSAAFVKAFEFSLKPLDKERFGQAAAMDKAVRATEKLSHPTLYVNKSLLVMLPDDDRAQARGVEGACRASARAACRGRGGRATGAFVRAIPVAQVHRAQAAGRAGQPGQGQQAGAVVASGKDDAGVGVCADGRVDGGAEQAGSGGRRRLCGYAHVRDGQYRWFAGGGIRNFCGGGGNQESGEQAGALQQSHGGLCFASVVGGGGGGGFGV